MEDKGLQEPGAQSEGVIKVSQVAGHDLLRRPFVIISVLFSKPSQAGICSRLIYCMFYVYHPGM